MTDWRRKAAEEILKEIKSRGVDFEFDLTGTFAQIISQAEPEQKGLEECAREICETIEKITGETIQCEEEILPILRTLAPECHIEAAAGTIWHLVIETTGDRHNINIPSEGEIASELRNHLREAPEPTPDE